ncbi:MAG TPA: DUF4404 family protein [Ignavibacteria bacterium]|nr:DUF4404 family protein [Ignavibacteria bacterium]
MLHKLTELEENVRNSKLPENQKTEILNNIDDLRTEYISSGEQHTNPVKASYSALRKSILEFEKEHPTLVKNVNEISTMLSNMGI